jgi:uncharacterized protein (TIRG00374 family)
VTESDEPPVRRRRSVVVRWTLGLAMGAVAVWVVLAAGGGIGDSWSAIWSMDLWWLGPALVVEAASYVVLGLKLRRLVGREAVTAVEAIELGLVVSGFGLLTPASPAEGLALAGRHLRRRGLSRRRVTLVFGFSEWFSSRVFLLVGAVNLLVVAVVERDPVSDLWPFLAAAIVVLALLAVTARLASRSGAAERVSQFAGSLHRPSRRVPVEVRRAKGAAWYSEARALVGPPRSRALLASLTAIALLADVACLWFALLATGSRVGFEVALLAITVAAAATFVPLVPGGLGIVEAAIPAVFHHFGVPYEQGLAAALVYRAFGTFVPAAVGALAIVGLRAYIPASSTTDGRSEPGLTG